jgi:hypothetical protein
MIKKVIFSFVAATFIMGGFSVYSAATVHAQSAGIDTSGVLGVTQITATKTYATADNTYADGWQWVFDVTVPNSQSLLKMKFADWVNGSNIIPAGGNMQFYSAQSTNAYDEAHAIPITASSTWSDIMNINPNTDLSVQNGGRQIQIVVETKVSVGTPGGSFSTSYGINTTATSSISFDGLIQTYNSNPLSVTVITDPSGLANTVTYTGTDGTVYPSTTTAPNHVGTYTVYSEVTDPGYTGTSTATLKINPASISVVADPKTKVYDGATTTDPVLTYVATPIPFGSDKFTGQITRLPGEDVGSYSITQGTLALSSDYLLDFSPSTLTITKATASVTLGDLVQTYDKTSKSVTITTVPAGLNTDVTYDGSSDLPVNAGNYIVVATINEGNYEGSTTGNLVIDPAPLTVTATTSTKVYNASTGSDGVPSITSGKLFGSDSAVWSQTFDTKDVGTNKTLTATGIITDGNSGKNYDVSFVTDTTGSITPATATVSASGVNKTYDGNTDATVNLHVDSAIGSDVLSATGNATFDTKDASTSKTVTVTGIVVTGPGVTSDDYVYNTSTTTTADITPAPLTVTAKDESKLYGSTFNFNGTEFTTSPSVLLSPEDIITSATLTSEGAVATASTTGSPYPIVVSDLQGVGLGNYNISYVNGSMSVTQKVITATITADNKVYDGTTNATTTNCTLNDVTNGDDVSCIASNATFADRNVGDGKLVTADVTLDGTDAANYTLTSPVTTTANITARPITVTATTTTKVYNALIDSDGVPSITSGSIATDDAAPTWTQSYNDKNVGNNKVLTPAGIVNDGNSGKNYDVIYATTTGEITAKDLIVTAKGVDKTYDASTTATVTLSDDRISGDVFTDAYTSANYLDANVGTGKQVDVHGITISGTDAGNYNLTNDSASTTASINPASLTITANDITKVYGDTVVLGATSTGFMTNGLQGSDKVSGIILTSAGDVLTAKISGSPYVLTPSDATGTPGLSTNYSIDYKGGKLTVTPKLITGSLTASDKTYDGGQVASTSCTLSGVINNDVVSCDTSLEHFVSRNVGAQIAKANLALSGADAANYELVNTIASTTANIHPLAITVTAVTDTRPYDGTTNSSAIPNVSLAVISPDTSNFIETFDSADAGSRVLTPSGSVDDGNHGNNYVITFASTTGTITKAEQTITFSDYPNGFISGNSFNITAQTTSGLTDFDFSVSPANVCTLGSSSNSNPATVDLAGSGDCTVKVNQFGNNNYFAAQTASKIFTIVYNTSSGTTTYSGYPN